MFSHRFLLVSIALMLASMLAAVTLAPAGISAPPPERDRSPSSLALRKDGVLAVTANSTADSVSLVNLASGTVIAEVAVGQRPFAIALSPDSKQALVSNQLSDSITLLDVKPTSIEVTATIAVGDEPRGVAFSSDGTRAFVALAGENALAVVNIKTKQILSKTAVGAEPWHVALTPDGKRLAVGCARSQEMIVLDAFTLQTLHSVKLRGHNVRHVAVAPDGAWAFVPNIAERGRPATKENIDQGWVTASRLSRAPLREEGPREAIALDPRGKAVGDVDGVAVSPDGNTIALTAAGTHELILLRLPLPFVAFGGPGDHIESELLRDPTRLRRIPLGGRPLAVQFANDGKTVVVATYLSNSLQIVAVDTGQITRTVDLGSAKTPSLARRGEAIFYDAQRSFNQWDSCSTCHDEGPTNGSNFDTFNDGSYDTPKKTPSLRGVTATAPWTWHGAKPNLRQLVHDSVTKSMQGEPPSEADLDALMAFLATLELPRSPYRNLDGTLTASAKRGEAVFQAKGCDTCHAPPLYTNASIYKVGLESPMDAYQGFNPPSLRNIYNRAPYLHDGSARGLETVLTQKHRASELTGKPDPTPEELKDLIAFLKAL